MTRHILFVAPPAHGHINPTLPVVSELVRRGWRVSYATHERFAAAVRRAGATHVPTTSRPPRMTDLAPERIGSLMEDLVGSARVDVPRLAAYVQDDPVRAVCYDRMSPLSIAPILAARAGVPDIALWPSLAFTERSSPFGRPGPEAQGPFDNPALHRARQAIADLAAEYGVGGRAAALMGGPLAAPAPLNIVFVAPAFQPDADSFDERFRFVGPSLGVRESDPTWQPPGDQPVVYVSLGTGFNNRPDIFRACLGAFADSGRPVAMAIGEQVTRDQLGPIPATVEVRPWFPQLAVLRHAAAFVSHAGMNSVMEALYHGVPLVSLPQMVEQEINARRVEELGLGPRLDPEHVTPEQLRAAVEAVVDDDATRARLAAMRASARQAGGAPAAADAIEEHLGT